MIFTDHRGTRGFAARRPELWCQGAQRVHRPRGPVHRTHWGNGCFCTGAPKCCSHHWGGAPRCYGKGTNQMCHMVPHVAVVLLTNSTRGRQNVCTCSFTLTLTLIANALKTGAILKLQPRHWSESRGWIRHLGGNGGMSLSLFTYLCLVQL